MVAQITPLPTPPSRQDPANFSARGDAFLGALPQFQVEANALASEVNIKAASTSADSQSASNSALIATTKAAEAVSAANIAVPAAASAEASAAAANLSAQNAATDAASVAEALAGIAGGPVASVAGLTGVVTKTQLEGAGFFTDQNLIEATQQEVNEGIETTPRLYSPLLMSTLLTQASVIERVVRTTAETLTISNISNFIELSGTFVQTFDSCSSLKGGWWTYIANAGDGDITLQPSLAETIDGLSSFVMYPNEIRLVLCDGSSLRSVVVSPFYKVFESSGSFVKPPGYSQFSGMLWGAGAGGAKGATVSGGGGGACSVFQLRAAQVGQIEAVVIGSGGLGASSDGAGQPGGSSSFGQILAGGGVSAAGGVPARGGHSYVPFNVISSSTSEAVVAGNAADASNKTTVYGGGGSTTISGRGATIYGGAGGGSVASGSLVAPSLSVFGGDGGVASLAGTAGSGLAPGGGGGASATGVAGNGGRGELRIWGGV